MDPRAFGVFESLGLAVGAWYFPVKNEVTQAKSLAKDEASFPQA